MAGTYCIHARPLDERCADDPCPDCRELFLLRDVEHFVRKLDRQGPRRHIVESLRWALNRIDAHRAARPGALETWVSKEAEAAERGFLRGASTIPAPPSWDESALPDAATVVEHRLGADGHRYRVHPTYAGHLLAGCVCCAPPTVPALSTEARS